MGFVNQVFSLATKLFDCVQRQDLEGVRIIKVKQALLWANASDEDLKNMLLTRQRNLELQKKML